MPSPDIVVLGDINLDYVVRSNLPFSFQSVVQNGVIWWNEIDEIPGGSGLNFCAIARKAGYRCLLLSRVGDDTAGAFITRWLDEKQIARPRNWTSASPTGKAIITRDSLDIRLLINNTKNANHALCREDIEAHRQEVQQCRVLYLSGYCLKEKGAPRLDAALLAMEYAHSAPAGQRPVIVFDVVPHRVYETLGFEEFLAYTKHVDILVSEVATLRRFLGLGSKTETITTEMARETAQALRAHYDRLLLRYGPSGCDVQIAVDHRQDRFECVETGHRTAEEKRGFGDLLALKALETFFDVLSPAA